LKVGTQAVIRETAHQQRQQTDQAERTHQAAGRHRENLLGAVRHAERVPDPDRSQQADAVAEEQADDADMEKNIAEAQAAAMQELARIGLPRILLAIEADQAAEQKDRQRDIRVNPEGELMQVVHGYLLMGAVARLYGAVAAPPQICRVSSVRTSSRARLSDRS
jgi:hypothetical protein